MLFGNSLSAQAKTLVKNDSIKFKFDQKFISISPLISPRICIGIVSTNKLKNQHYSETIVYLHACESLSVYKVYGIAARINQFFAKNKKSGCFWIMNVGLKWFLSNIYISYVW